MAGITYRERVFATHKTTSVLHFPYKITYLCPWDLRTITQTMESMEVYFSPDVQVLYIIPEGVLSASNESLLENEGEW